MRRTREPDGCWHGRTSIPRPWREQPHSFAGTVSTAVQEFCCFCNTCTAQHFNNNRDNGFSRNPETHFDAAVKPVIGFHGCIRGCPERQGFVELGIETFHGNTEQFTGYHNPASQEGQARNTPADGFTGKRKQFRGNGKILGC